MENNQSEKDVKKGLSSFKSVTNTVIAASKSGVAKSVTVAIFTNPVTLIVFGIVLVLLLLLSVISASTPLPSVFNSQSADIGEVSWTLNDGYEAKKKEAINDIVKEINSRYPDYNVNKISIPAYDHGYHLTYDNDSVAVDIDVLYAPDVEEFANIVNAYANAVNGTIAFFQNDEAQVSQDTDFRAEQPIINRNPETGEYEVSDYYKEITNDINSQYVDSQVPDFFDSLAEQAYNVFSYDGNTDNWNWNINEAKKRKSREIKSCTYTNLEDSSKSYTVDKACSERKGYEATESSRTEYYYIPYLRGKVTVYMACDLEKFKKTQIDEIKKNIVGQEIFVDEYVDGKKTTVKKVLDENLANTLVEESINTYYATYLSAFYEGTVISGYSGYITSSGWNYSAYVNADIQASNLFWLYAESLRPELKKLPYAKFHLASGGMAYAKNCTLFAATFFYDVHGFAALRGDGNHQADNLIIDCGIDNENACPVKFARSTSVAPGAIVSLYPNHVICINEVKQDGTVVISEGNVNLDHAIKTNIEYSSLNAYASANGMTIKTIAVPVK